MPTGKKDNDNQIIPFLKFLFILTLSILRFSSRTLMSFERLNYFITYFQARKSESEVYCRFMKYVLKTVRAIKSGGAARFLINWVVLEKNMCEVVCVVGWVWGMVTKKILQLGKCFESFVNPFIFSGSSHMSKASLVSKPSIISKLNLVCQIISNIITNFFISTTIMLSLTIYLALLCQNIESNPGPHRHGATTLSIKTYNCNGLDDPKKLKRLLLKVNVLVNKGCIVFLQETHIVNTKYLEIIWKHGILSNCVKTNWAGVIILYNKQYDLVHKYADREGRQLIAVLGNDKKKVYRCKCLLSK